MATNKNKHLTQDDRNVIAIGIVNGSSKKDIADNLGKDKYTIGKEIRAHRYLSHKSTLSLECENYAHCKFKRKNCTVNCPDYSKSVSYTHLVWFRSMYFSISFSYS